MKGISSVTMGARLTRALLPLGSSDFLLSYAFEYHQPCCILRWCCILLFGNGIFCSQTVTCKASGRPSHTLVCTLSNKQLSPSENLPMKKKKKKSASSGKVAAFHRGNLPSACTNTDNIWEGNKKHFAISPTRIKVIFHPGSLAVEGFDCIALVMLPFGKFIFVLRGCAVFPLHQVSLYLAQSASMM